MPKTTTRIYNTKTIKEVITKLGKYRFEKAFENIPPEKPKTTKGFYLENNGHKVFLMYELENRERYIIAKILPDDVPKEGWQYHVPKRSLDTVFPAGSPRKGERRS